MVRRGLTLVELLMSVVILSVGAVFIMQALVKISSAHVIAENQAQASLLAMSKMAEVELAVQAGAFSEDPEQGGSVRVGAQAFTWSATAAPLADDPTRTRIYLTVSWRRGESAGERQLETILRLPPDPSVSSS